MVVAPENPLTGEPAAGSVPGSVAVAACEAMALFYVAILYSPTLILRLPPPSSLDSFMIWRFACAIVSSAISVLASAILLGAPFTEELVFRACMIPMLLCGGFKTYSIIFLSPVFFSLELLHCQCSMILEKGLGPGNSFVQVGEPNIWNADLIRNVA